MGKNEFLFGISFNLKMLADFIEQKILPDKKGLRREYIADFLERVKSVDYLKTNDISNEFFERNVGLIEEAFEFIFPEAGESRNSSIVVIPFTGEYIFSRKCYEGKFCGAYKQLSYKQNMAKMNMLAYSIILDVFYGIKSNHDIPLTMKADICGEVKHFQIVHDSKYVNIELHGELPKLTDEAKTIIVKNISDMEIVSQYLPPEIFEFTGFAVMTAIDVTVQQEMADIKYELLEKGSITVFEKFKEIEEKIAAIVGIPELDVDIAAMRDDYILILNTEMKMEKNCIFMDSKHITTKELDGYIMKNILKNGERFFIGDILEVKNKGILENDMIAMGKRSAMIMPLMYRGKLTGGMIFSSEIPGRFNEINMLPIDELKSVFANAVKKSLDEFEETIGGVIQEKFTSIHPAVAWKFRKTATEYLDGKRVNEEHDIEPIIFEHVYPLYSITDIRSSSQIRNDAIQSDLMEHLKLAVQVIKTAQKYKDLPLLDEILYKIDKSAKNIEENLDSGEEIRVINFLKNEMEPFFDDLKEFSKETKDAIDTYKKAMESEAGTLYRKRKDFDKSVGMINRAVTTYVDSAQNDAQDMFPHYFDKQVTDGVDQSIYIGASLTKGGKFDRLYLKNLRLWQFIVMCNLVRLTDSLKKAMPVKLETTHLIIVQDMPITIFFDFDEKRFRVEGAYNIRYEIMKKRIDKAVIKNTDERITKPQHIVIVYSQPTEENEYREYIEYLTAREYIEGETEYYPLEDMQGIRGLKAMRVRVKTSVKPEKDEYEFMKIKAE